MWFKTVDILQKQEEKLLQIKQEQPEQEAVKFTNHHNRLSSDNQAVFTSRGGDGANLTKGSSGGIDEYDFDSAMEIESSQDDNNR